MLRNIAVINDRPKTITFLAVDLLIICIIYLLPSLSHITSIPFYLFEPMRLALVFCIITSDKKNSVIIAITLPLISLLISSHPAVIKSLIITSELLLNVLLFYYFSKRWNLFLSMFSSILLAKAFYYSAKAVLIYSGLISGELISTPIWIQGTILLFLSLGILILYRKRSL